MDQRPPDFAPAAGPGRLAPVPLPPGRLGFDQVAAALVADGLVAEGDLERIRLSAQGARNAEVHPLVLLANLKLAATGTATRWAWKG